MRPCEQISRQALALVALACGWRELNDAWAHARTCTDCAQLLRWAERMLVMVDAALIPSQPSTEALLHAKEAVEIEFARPALASRTARAAAAAATISAGAALAWPLARHRYHFDASSLVLGAGAAVMAAALAWLGLGRRPAAAALAACAVSLAVAAVFSVSPGLFAALGVHCLLLELFTAAWPLAALAMTGGLSASTSAWATAAVAAAGALAGQAALHLTCPEQAAAPHLLAFHFGGVMLAALVGSAVPRALRALA